MVVVLLNEENYKLFMKIYSTQKLKKYSGELSETFIIEPLDIGQGITIGNTLRRILLSELYGFAITDIQLTNISHEFEQLNNCREDITEILLNLKQVILKPTFSFLRDLSNKNTSYKLLFKMKGPAILTAGMLNIPNQLKIINPNAYICTITNDSEIEILLTIKYSKLFRTLNDLKHEFYFEKTYLNEGFSIDIDAIFNPIKMVNYKIKLIHDTNGNIKESLVLEIITNGSITPKRALVESANICLKTFYPILAAACNINSLNTLLEII